MKNSDFEKRFGMKLKDAYMKENVGTLMSRDEFHRLINKAENRKKKRRVLTGAAAAGVALCLIFGGFVAGMSMRESASAGRDDYTKTVQQGNGVVIGSGGRENEENVGVSTKTYTRMEDIPEYIREQIRFLDSDEFELQKVKVTFGKESKVIDVQYGDGEEEIQISQKAYENRSEIYSVLPNKEKYAEKNGCEIFYERCDDGDVFCIVNDNVLCYVFFSKGIEEQKEKAVIDDLIN